LEKIGAYHHITTPSRDFSDSWYAYHLGYWPHMK